jgi:hypothetical protein
MSESKSPVICVTCQRPFPHDRKLEDAPKYFAQYNLLTRSDDAMSLLQETETLLRYVRTAAWVVEPARKIAEDLPGNLNSLILDLTEEAHRHVKLAGDALEEIWDRHHGQTAPTPAKRGA